MSTASSGFVNARTAAFSAGTTPEVFTSHSRFVSQWKFWRNQRCTAAKYVSSMSEYP